MEDDLQTMAVTVGENVLIEFHHLLLVAAEEVHLDTGHTDLLHPCHLTLTGNRGAHAVVGSLRGIVPGAVGVGNRRTPLLWAYCDSSSIRSRPIWVSQRASTRVYS